MESVKIMRAVFDDGDVEELEDLHRRTFPNDASPDWDLGHWWFARVCGEAVGFVGIETHNCDPGSCYLTRLGVYWRFAGAGIAKRLVRKAMSSARKMDLHEVCSDTRKNPVSANVLIACGFRQFAPPKPWAYAESDYWRVKL
jgi:ribosomal protein S18 acetylase RimI-like enzyme